MTRAYYNEFDPSAAAWLRELIARGLIAPGDVDTRSVEDVIPSDLVGYTQCHFFAGIGGWSCALRLAGWPDDRPVWTGSCPCQPFSAAGKGAGFADERHLWPAFHWLIEQCRPPVVFGEQVASADGLRWLDLVHADLEGSGYAVGAADLCAAGFGAPHIRQRLYWMADACSTGLEGCDAGAVGNERPAAQRDGSAGGLEHPGQQGLVHVPGAQQPDELEPGHESVLGRVADADDGGQHALLRAGQNDSAQNVRGCTTVRSARRLAGRDEGEPGGVRGVVGEPSPSHSFWRDADWLCCRDGKWRPVEPGTFPLAHGLPARVVPSSRIGMEIDANKTAEARVMRLRGYGNAIVPQVAAAFISASTE